MVQDRITSQFSAQEVFVVYHRPVDPMPFVSSYPDGRKRKLTTDAHPIRRVRPLSTDYVERHSKFKGLHTALIFECRVSMILRNFVGRFAILQSAPLSPTMVAWSSNSWPQLDVRELTPAPSINPDLLAKPRYRNDATSPAPRSYMDHGCGKGNGEGA